MILESGFSHQDSGITIPESGDRTDWRLATANMRIFQLADHNLEIAQIASDLSDSQIAYR